MGKKSRQKRERKMERNTADPGFLLRELRSFQRPASHKADLEKVFQNQLEATRDVLRRYKHIDVAIALNVSDLWPANAASPIKHIFAWAVLLDLGQSDPEAKPIASFEDFQTFAKALYSAWPEFPMLEDFTPEADWGETRVRLGEDFVPMFYGSCIERTPDFVEAFRITYGAHPEAHAQMDLAVSVQAHIIKTISDKCAVHTPELRPGHIEIPHENFWDACRGALLTVGNEIADWRQKAGFALDASFGAFKAPLTWDTFGSSVMQGIALPFLAVAEGNEWIPLSVRSGPGVVIDHWAEKGSSGVSLQTHRMLARFVMERFPETVRGPLTLIIGEVACEDLPVSCVIAADSRVYLVCACEHASNARLARAAKDVYAKLRSKAPVHFRFTDRGALMLSKDGPTELSVDELRILIVVTQSSTAFGSIVTLPHTRAMQN